MKKEIINKKLLAVLIGIGSAALIYLVFGMVTSVIQNRFFTRMTPVGWLEYASLGLTSLMMGAYFGIAFYAKSANKVCDTTAAAGGVFGFLTFGCSICNKILVFFLGVAGVLTYFDPLRPFLGIVSIFFLGFAIYKKAENITAA
ncbi:hypothetical protein J4234_03365 [Candidatus Woesearchaeota archaeon]|nr:hypothetical protein [Candidatus Woesearchaeota archaeon]